jgi:hypothetical protein
MVAAVVMAALAVTVARSAELESAAEQQRAPPTTASLHPGPEASAGKTAGEIIQRNGADGSTVAHSGSKARISRIRIFGSSLQW